MNLDGYGLWQDRENLAVRRVHPNLESLGAWNGRAAGAGAYLAKAGTMSWCFILREPNDGTHEVWLNHLGQMSLI